MASRPDLKKSFSTEDTLSRFQSTKKIMESSDHTIIFLDPKKILPFSHRTTILHPEKIDEMRQSVIQKGIIQPAIVRCHPEKKGYYEMIAGYHRQALAIELGLELPCMIEDLSDDEAIIISADSNLQGGFDRMLPSEIARTLKAKYEAEKRQGKRTDLHPSKEEPETSGPEYQKLRWDLRGKQARKYVRIAELSESLLDLLDQGFLGINAAYLVSFLSSEEQDCLARILTSGLQVQKINDQKAQILKDLSEQKALSESRIKSILMEKRQPVRNLSLPYSKIERYISGKSKKEAMEYIVKALDFYESNQTYN